VKNIFLIFIFTSIANILYSQSEIDLSKDFIYKGKHYSPHSPWVTTGFGYGYNIFQKTGEPNFLFDIHFRIKKKYYFGIGYSTSREQFLDKNGQGIFLPYSFAKNSLNSIHIMYGYRKIGLKNNYGIFIGPSLNSGYSYIYSNKNGDYHKSYLEPGIYISTQYTQKIYYDLGVGLTLWYSFNKTYQIIGLSLHFYLSSAFKREII